MESGTYDNVEYKLFVGGLSESVDNDSLYEAFEVYGEIPFCKVCVDINTGSSRGFGFVCYSSKSSADSAIEEMNGYVLDGRMLSVKPAEDPGQSTAPMPTDDASKLFVRCLAWETDDASLRSAFEPHGTVVYCRVQTDRITGRSRGFGFVCFASTAEAKAAVGKMDQTVLDGRTINVMKAQPKSQSRPFKGKGSGGGGGGASWHDGSGQSGEEPQQPQSDGWRAHRNPTGWRGRGGSAGRGDSQQEQGRDTESCTTLEVSVPDANAEMETEAKKATKKKGKDASTKKGTGLDKDCREFATDDLSTKDAKKKKKSKKKSRAESSNESDDDEEVAARKEKKRRKKEKKVRLAKEAASDVTNDEDEKKKKKKKRRAEALCKTDGDDEVAARKEKKRRKKKKKLRLAKEAASAATNEDVAKPKKERKRKKHRKDV